MPDVVDERFSVQLMRERLANVSVGDAVPIQVPGQDSMLAIVEVRDIGPNGDRYWRGHIQSGGDRYPVVYTQGDEATFATICTPAGTYALEALGDRGQLFIDNRFEAAPLGGTDTLEATKE